MPEPKTSIVEIRFKNGRLTQAQFAKKIGVSPQTVSAWEKDIKVISAKHLLKIHEVFGVNSSELLGA